MIRITVVLLLLFVSYTEVSALDIYKDIILPGQDPVGTPYRCGGTTPSGFDCSGFVNYLYRKFALAYLESPEVLHLS